MGRRDSNYKSSFRDFRGKEEEGKGSGLGGFGKSSLLEVSWTFQIHSFLLRILLPVLTLFISLTLSLQAPSMLCSFLGHTDGGGEGTVLRTEDGKIREPLILCFI